MINIEAIPQFQSVLRNERLSIDERETFFFSLHWLAVDRQTRRKVRSERLDVCIMCPTVYSIAEKKSFNIHGDVRCLFGLHLQPVY